jgi:hypothetical protein
MDDLISRQAAIDAMYHHFCDKSREECAQILHEVPSVTPQANKEDIHREREQAYMRGYEDGSRKYRTISTETTNRCDLISREWLKTAIHNFYYGLQHTPTEEDIQAYIDAAPSVSTEKTDAYKLGWHDAICKALDEAYDIVIDGERFSVVQEETLIGLGMAYEQVSTEKTGQWYIDERPESNREIICSNCEQPVFKYHKLDFDYRPKYCPNCGAKMGVEE